ncbi:unnamed protein product, partial [Prorocentrum cordatum]
ILESATRIKMFFDPTGSPRLTTNSRGKTRRPGTKDLTSVLRCSETKFVDFLQGCLSWDPKDRFTPQDALDQEWILEGYARHPARDPAGRSGQPEASPPSSSSRKRMTAGTSRSTGGHG